MSGRPTEVRASVILVDKPEGPTSHDIVRRARRALGVRRVGHTGTLDPFASGLLILCAGRATRLVAYFHLLEKRYRATAVLGAATATDDPTGPVTRRSSAWTDITEEDVRAALGRLEGDIEQLPPAYSAKKVGGRRAYEIARGGGSPALATAHVRVHRLSLLAYRPPTIEFEAIVSTGTYVRALARDLGADLGCPSHLSGLRRTGIGPFAVERSVELETLERGEITGAAVMTPAEALSWLPSRRLAAAEAERVRQGGMIETADAEGGDPKGPVALLVQGRLVAVGRIREGRVYPEKVLDAW